MGSATREGLDWYASLAISVSAELHDEVRPENKPEYIKKSEEINENWWMRLVELVGLAWLGPRGECCSTGLPQGE
jgi:hypothetical protein